MSDATSMWVLISNWTIFVAESVTVIVKVKDPAAVGVPERTPVAGFNVKPAGSDPVVTANVYGLMPPVAASVVV